MSKKTPEVKTTEVVNDQNGYKCVRCGYEADSYARMNAHIDRKNPCRVLTLNGINVDLSKYKTQLLDRTFVDMYRCYFCNSFFDDKDIFINHKNICDQETLKKLPVETYGRNKNNCIICNKGFNFKDPNHSIVCNETIDEYEETEKEKIELEDKLEEGRSINRRITEELLRFLSTINKFIDDYNRTKIDHEEEE